ncbi:MAG: Rpn family recombination-promoting nuclease/putative transposase [Lachnospiraceae bacterium]|nr:Rpn family recombination-promoting nuclease/putative transposase [Lachnospiraceae bacterium]
MIHGTGNEDITLTEGTVTYDIRFLATAPVSGELIRLIINIEAQNDFYPGYPLIKRAIYYCSRMISAQYGTEFTESHYEKIKKIYSIWICMNPPKNRENSITRYYISEENLVGGVKERKADYDLMAAVMICLGREDSDTGIRKLLNILLSTETGSEDKCQMLEEDFHIKMTQKLESEVSLMCNYSETNL